MSVSLVARSTETRFSPGGRSTTYYPDGMVETLVKREDPRWGVQVPLIGTLTRTTPGGLSSTIEQSSTINLEPGEVIRPMELVVTTVIDGHPWATVYNGDSQSLELSSPTGRTVVSTIDGQGRVVRYQASGVAAQTATYDSRGRLINVTRGDGPGARKSTFEYASDGSLSLARDSSGVTTAYTFDRDGRLSSAHSSPHGSSVDYGRDADGDITSLTPSGGGSHQFSYASQGVINGYRAPGIDSGIGARTAFSYNADAQLSEVSQPNGAKVGLSYDSGGELSGLAIQRGTVAFGYNNGGRLAEVNDPGGARIALSYDGVLLTSTGQSGAVSGTVDYGYNSSFSVQSLSIDGGSRLEFEYDADELLSRAGGLTLTRDPQSALLVNTALDATDESFTYNSFGEETGHRVTVANQTIFEAQYDRDPTGRIVESVENVAGTSSMSSYTYDEQGRLEAVDADGARVAAFTYDANGNRLTATASGGKVLLAKYDRQDRLTEYDGMTYSYNDSGQLGMRSAAGAVASYSYDPLGNLLRVRTPDGAEIRYTVDGFGRRVAKRLGGAIVQQFVYGAGASPVAELDGAGNVRSQFIYGSRDHVPDYMIKDGFTYRIILDQRDSPRLIINAATGEVVERLEYDAFGHVLMDTNPGFQPFGFAGGLYDAATGLVRFGARDYDPVTGRWTAKDPAGFGLDGHNLYVYVNGDPVNFVDPSGFSAFRPGPNHIDLPKAGGPGYEEALERAVENSKRYPTTDAGHFQKYLESVKAAARRGCTRAIEIARPILERGKDLGRGAATIVTDFPTNISLIVIVPIPALDRIFNPPGFNDYEA